MNTIATPQQPVHVSKPSGILKGRIRQKLFSTVFLAALLAVVILECLYHYTAGSTAAWGTGFRISVTLIVSVLAGNGLAMYFTNGWVAQLSSIKETLDSMAAGDGTRRAETNGSDELSEIAIAVNALCDRLQNENASVLGWDSGDAAAGTSNANSGQLVPNGLPTAINTEQSASQFGRGSAATVGDVLAEVQAFASQVSSRIQEIQPNTEKLSADSDHYVSQFQVTADAVDEIVESIREVAENTSTSAEVAEEARRTATTGSEAVSNTIEGMERIRNQVQSTSKRIKQLGESSQQIGEIVQLISDVADRTSLLALNASIQAAMAGEAGQGFGVVAEEVERLSQRCNEASKQIAQLVKSIQSETSKAIAGMEESIAEVVEGSKLASQAGDALDDIDSVSNRLAELIDTISLATKQQVRGGVLASRSIGEISSVMHDSAASTKQAAEDVSGLAALADELKSSVERFQAAAKVERRAAEQQKTGDVKAPSTPEPLTPVGAVDSESGWPTFAADDTSAPC